MQITSALTRMAKDPAPVFWVLALSMLALFAISWPIELSLDLWVFKDRGNLLNLERLLDHHLRIGVDAYYAYGLLPVMIQHALFAVFGQGPWPLIGCHAAYAVLMAVAWTALVRETGRPLLYTAVVVLMVPIIIWVNPNFPYVLVQLSILLSMALVLRRNARMALAVSAVGCWSVPTITLLFSGMLLALLVVEWYRGTDRRLATLVRLLMPGAVAYAALGALIAVVFGWRSTLATALPLQGMAFYKTVHYGMFTSLKIFLYPGPAPLWPYPPIRYYLFARATWWLYSTLLLFGLAGYAAVRMFKGKPSPLTVVTLLCGLIQLSFILFAYGTPQQHLIYDPILVFGVIAGASSIPAPNTRQYLLAIFVVLGVLSHVNQAAYTLSLWRKSHVSELTQPFYALEDFRAEWADVVARSEEHRVFLLSYGTGMQHYYPTIRTADSWTVQLGQIFDADKARLLEQMRSADMVVEDVSAPVTLFDTDPDIIGVLDSLCLVEIKTYFIIWTKRQPGDSQAACQTYHRELPANPRLRGEFTI